MHATDVAQLQPVKSHKLYQDLLAPYLDLALQLSGVQEPQSKVALKAETRPGDDRAVDQWNEGAEFDAQTGEGYSREPGLAASTSSPQSDRPRSPSAPPSEAQLAAEQEVVFSNRQSASVGSESSEEPVQGIGSEDWDRGVALRAEDAGDRVDFENFPRRASRGPASVVPRMNEPLSRAAYQRVLSMLNGGNCQGADREIERSVERFSLRQDSEWVVKVRSEFESRCF